MTLSESILQIYSKKSLFPISAAFLIKFEIENII